MARYIDVEKIDFKGLDAYIDSQNEIFVSVSAIKSILAQIPTADVAQVVHGRWLVKADKSSFYRWKECSVCRRTIDFNRHEPYCHCGAKMVGKDVEEE